MRQVGRAKQPRTFLVDGGPVPRRVGVALEEIFLRQQELERQNAERESGRRDDPRRHAGWFARRRCRAPHHSDPTRTFSSCSRLREISLGTPLSETVRDTTLDQLISRSAAHRRIGPERDNLASLASEARSQRRADERRCQHDDRRGRSFSRHHPAQTSSMKCEGISWRTFRTSCARRCRSCAVTSKRCAIIPKTSPEELAAHPGSDGAAFEASRLARGRLAQPGAVGIGESESAT